MPKSPVVIAAIGIGGCVALSIVMRSALQLQHERERDPLERRLEGHFGHRLVGPASVSTEERSGKSRLVVELCVIAGLRKQAIVAAAGRLAWESRAADEAPAEVVVTVTDDGPGETLTRTVARPRFGY